MPDADDDDVSELIPLGDLLDMLTFGMIRLDDVVDEVPSNEVIERRAELRRAQALLDEMEQELRDLDSAGLSTPGDVDRWARQLMQVRSLEHGTREP